MISASEVNVAHGQREVLVDLSLQIQSGFVGLLGVNGAGKTTLLTSLAGIRRPDTGAVEVNGVDLYGSHSREARQRIALVPQELELPGRLRVVEFLEYMAWLRRVPKAERHAVVVRTAELMGLGDRLQSPVSTLSGGMRRRVLIAQALLSDPEVLLLDEPTTGLDPEQRHNVRELLGKIAEERVVLMSSHVLEDLAVLAPRLVILHEGGIRFDGSLAELRAADRSGQGDPETGFLSIVRGVS